MRAVSRLFSRAGVGGWQGRAALHGTSRLGARRRGLSSMSAATQRFLDQRAADEAFRIELETRRARTRVAREAADRMMVQQKELYAQMKEAEQKAQREAAAAKRRASSSATGQPGGRSTIT